MPAGAAEEARAVMLELFPEGFEERARGGRVELAAYTDASGAAAIWRAFGEFTESGVDDGWEDRWRRFHRPVRVGPLWVGPPWERSPRDAVAVVIDPGRAFGTGAHETTRLCLELLLDLPRGSLLDVGCGSGVVAVAAAKVGFRPVIALDHDEAAVDATRRNALANGVDVDVRSADAFADELPRSDAAVANLSLAACERVAERLEQRDVVTSGYLASERLRVRGFVSVDRRERSGWAADRWRRG